MKDQNWYKYKPTRILQQDEKSNNIIPIRPKQHHMKEPYVYMCKSII